MKDEKEKTACVPLPLVGAGQEAPPWAESERPAVPLLFRGIAISWAVSRQTRSVVERNAFGGDEIEERPGRKLNLIWYGGTPYQKEAFYKMAF